MGRLTLADTKTFSPYQRRRFCRKQLGVGRALLPPQDDSWCFNFACQCAFLNLGKPELLELQPCSVNDQRQTALK